MTPREVTFPFPEPGEPAPLRPDEERGSFDEMGLLFSSYEILGRPRLVPPEPPKLPKLPGLPEPLIRLLRMPMAEFGEVMSAGVPPGRPNESRAI